MKKILLLLLLFSCRKDVKEIPYKAPKTYSYEIKQGEHFSKGLQFRTHTERTSLNFSIIPYENCLYDLGNDNNYDINKFYGITWGFNPENNSFRIGWNCYRQNGKIQWFYYVHNWKVRNPAPSDPYDKSFLFESYPNEKKTFYVQFLRGFGKIRIMVDGDTTEVPFNFVNVPLTGIFNFPYFGGDQIAPHNMTVDVETKY